MPVTISERGLREATKCNAPRAFDLPLAHRARELVKGAAHKILMSRTARVSIAGGGLFLVAAPSTTAAMNNAPPISCAGVRSNVA